MASRDYERYLADLIQFHSDRGGLIPISLSSVPNVDLGQSIPCDETALCAQYKRSMIVSEIRFRCDCDSTSTGKSSGNNPGGQGGAGTGNALSFAASMRVGPVRLTDGYVQAAALCRREQYINGEVASLNFFKQQVMPDGLGSSTYTWKLDTPMFVPADVPITIDLRRSAQSKVDDASAQGDSIDSDASTAVVVGHYFKDPTVKAPPKIKFPYAYAYADTASVAQDIVSTAAAQLQRTVQATELNFKNNLGVMLELWRFIGRLYTRGYTYAGPTLNTGQIEYPGPEPTIRIGYSSGPAVVAPDKPFNSVFPLDTRSIEMAGMEMPPLAVFDVKVTKGISPKLIPNSGGNGNVVVYPVIGLLGAREVSW